VHLQFQIPQATIAGRSWGWPAWSGDRDRPETKIVGKEKKKHYHKSLKRKQFTTASFAKRFKGEEAPKYLELLDSHGRLSDMSLPTKKNQRRIVDWFLSWSCLLVAGGDGGPGRCGAGRGPGPKKGKEEKKGGNKGHVITRN
jgi:hypothetical protein